MGRLKWVRFCQFNSNKSLKWFTLNLFKAAICRSQFTKATQCILSTISLMNGKDIIPNTSKPLRAFIKVTILYSIKCQWWLLNLFSWVKTIMELHTITKLSQWWVNSQYNKRCLSNLQRVYSCSTLALKVHLTIKESNRINYSKIA